MSISFLINKYLEEQKEILFCNLPLSLLPPIVLNYAPIFRRYEDFLFTYLSHPEIINIYYALIRILNNYKDLSL
ncbi:MAG: hypothetical protein R6U96_10415 [Promethearchaeia archaeon]